MVVQQSKAEKPEGTPEDPALKFLGVVKTYNEGKGFGMIECPEAQQLWDREIYVYKDVLNIAQAQVDDTVCFGIHVNARGHPQASLPFYKIGEDGAPIGLHPESHIVYVEEEAQKDPNFLLTLKERIENKSQESNNKRLREKGGGKGGKDGKGGKGGKGGFDFGDPYGGKGGFDGGKGGKGGMSGKGWHGSPMDDWGKGGGGWGKGGGAWGGPTEVTLHIGGIPMNTPRREILHIFRQYAGFHSLRTFERDDHTLAFVDFETPEQASFVLDALNGYVWDLEADHRGPPLHIQFAQPKRRRTEGPGGW